MNRQRQLKCDSDILLRLEFDSVNRQTLKWNKIHSRIGLGCVRSWVLELGVGSGLGYHVIEQQKTLNSDSDIWLRLEFDSDLTRLTDKLLSGLVNFNIFLGAYPQIPRVQRTYFISAPALPIVKSLRGSEQGRGEPTTGPRTKWRFVNTAPVPLKLPMIINIQTFYRDFRAPLSTPGPGYFAPPPLSPTLVQSR
jgi:hypothetical protein